MKTILEYLINKNTKERKNEFKEFLEYFVSLGGNYKIKLAMETRLRQN